MALNLIFPTISIKKHSKNTYPYNNFNHKNEDLTTNISDGLQESIILFFINVIKQDLKFTQ